MLKMESFKSWSINMMSTFWKADACILLVDVRVASRQGLDSVRLGGGVVIVRGPNVNSRRRELTSQKYTTNYTILKDSPSGIYSIKTANWRISSSVRLKLRLHNPDSPEYGGKYFLFCFKRSKCFPFFSVATLPFILCVILRRILQKYTTKYTILKDTPSGLYVYV